MPRPSRCRITICLSISWERTKWENTSTPFWLQVSLQKHNRVHVGPRVEERQRGHTHSPAPPSSWKLPQLCNSLFYMSVRLQPSAADILQLPKWLSQQKLVLCARRPASLRLQQRSLQTGCERKSAPSSLLSENFVAFVWKWAAQGSEVNTGWGRRGEMGGVSGIQVDRQCHHCCRRKGTSCSPLGRVSGGELTRCCRTEALGCSGTSQWLAVWVTPGFLFTANVFFSSQGFMEALHSSRTTWVGRKKCFYFSKTFHALLQINDSSCYHYCPILIYSQCK